MGQITTVESPPKFEAAAFCFSHLRWDFVFQRPQHLISRMALERPVIFFEEPIFSEHTPWLELVQISDRLTIAKPHLREGCSETDSLLAQRQFLDTLIADRKIKPELLWYYSPMALGFSGHLDAKTIVYDCMDELTGFMGAPLALREMERKLFHKADLVFTGGQSLFEAKRQHHPAVHAFPSGVDLAHFLPARDGLADPQDQQLLPHPRMGFYGVLDERLDLPLLAALADARPEWSIILVGPVAKIDAEALPQRANIHYLGMKPYAELPNYLAGWDVALMPFAINEATRFISPTKTPEYLAGGLPVVATPITDVARHYGHLHGVRIAANAPDFIAAIEAVLSLRAAPETWRGTVDEVLADMSWDGTWGRMRSLIETHEVRTVRPTVTPLKQRQVPPPVTRVENPAPRIRRRAGFDYLIVGAGFAGSVLAERLASDSNQRVMLVDRRSHIGGNAYDHFDKSGLLVHRYGPHIFHTNSDKIFKYLSRFTSWRPYEHRVLANVAGKLLPVPINRTTVNGFFDLNLSEAEIALFLAGKAENFPEIANSEEVVLSKVGRELYEAFFRHYTCKQWGVEPRLLDKSVAGRIPVRHNDDDRYFSDSFQFMPRHGYTHMFENMLDHENISVLLNTDYRDIQEEFAYRHLIFTGPIDEFFDYRFGPLPYRSLRFEHRTIDQPSFQPTGVVNYPSAEVPFTRITEYKHLTGQSHAKTSISYEYPCADGDPYYPVPRPENADLYSAYQRLAATAQNTWFVGRLATYRYYNMDQIVAQALTLYDRLRSSRPAVQAAAPTGENTGALA